MLERPSRPAQVVALPGSQDDAALVAAVRAGRRGASHALYMRHSERIERVLVRVLGPDQDLPDLLHETFAQAFANLEKLEDPDRLGAWLRQIAVYVARGQIRYRQRRRWLTFPGTVPELEVVGPEMDERAAARAAMQVLERMGADLRIPFALRYLDGMELKDVADACDCSLATIKRRLAKANARFAALAKGTPALRELVETSDRWGER